VQLNRPDLPSRVVHFFRALGPGLITGAADDDPSGISTYSVAGATTGYSMLLSRGLERETATR
jgi:Mn2+/Fe2+ NRAMP family transporter